MRAGDITFLATALQTALLQGTTEANIRITEEQEVNTGVRKIKARIRPALFGVKEVGAFIELNSIISMWPEKTVGNTYKRRNGQKLK